MANIKIDLTHPLQDGETIVFKAPCDCTEVTGLIVYYPNEDGSNVLNQSFTFRDAHKNDLTGLGNLFSAGALVAVLVDKVENAAQLLNADTNKDLETRHGSLAFTATLSAEGWHNNVQTVSDERFVTEGYSYIVSIAPEHLVESSGTAIYAENVTTEGEMVFHSGDDPVIDITVNIMRVGVIG